MEILRYFMRWEDKYWGLYLVALLFLWLETKESEEMSQSRLWVATLFGAVSYLVFVCPLTYQAISLTGFDMDFYYVLSHIWLLLFFLPMAVLFAFRCMEDKGKKLSVRQITFLLGFLLILVTIGDFAYLKMDKKPSVLGVYQPDEVGAYELVLQDAGLHGYEEDMTIWGPYDWMAKSRIYDTRLTPIYGKDIANEDAPYDPRLKTLYVGYTGYEAQDSLTINKDQQLSAIAYFMDAFLEAPCRYVAVFDPKVQGSDVDAKVIFENYGYEMVGQAGSMQVYRFLGKE